MNIYDIDYSKAKATKQVKNFRILEGCIGKGISGEVYLAWNTLSSTLVAMKVIPQYKLSDNRQQISFAREIKALNSLYHQNIIRIYSFEKTINNVYVALEYCNGGTLKNLLNCFKYKYNTGIPEGLVQRILAQIADGLSYMHHKNLIHRDLKLDNILIHFPKEHYRVSFDEYVKSNFEGMIVKIADLGFTREINQNDTISTFCGSPINVAPDIINVKDIGYNLKADLWSLGAIAYEMIIGIPPFLGNEINEVFQKIQEGKYEYPSNCVISIEAISFINCLLTFDSELRFSANDVRTHPFITNDPITFNPVTLDIVPENLKVDGKIKVDSKDMNNFLWVMYKNNGKKPIEKLDKNDLENEDLLKSFCELTINTNEKKDLLSRFRENKKKVMEEKALIITVENKEILDNDNIPIDPEKNIENEKENENKEENQFEICEHEETEIDWNSYSIVEDEVEISNISEYVIDSNYIK